MTGKKDKRSIDITGRQFNNLTAIKRLEERKYGNIMWLCVCICKNKITATHYELRTGKKKSCGCKLAENRNKGALEYLKRDQINGTRRDMLDTKLYKNSTSGHKGVNWDKDKEKWLARITLAGKTKHLGYFDELENAVSARREAEEKYYKPYLERDDNDGN